MKTIRGIIKNKLKRISKCKHVAAVTVQSCDVVWKLRLREYVRVLATDYSTQRVLLLRMNDDRSIVMRGISKWFLSRTCSGIDQVSLLESEKVKVNFCIAYCYETIIFQYAIVTDRAGVQPIGCRPGPRPRPGLRLRAMTRPNLPFTGRQFFTGINSTFI